MVTLLSASLIHCAIWVIHPVDVYATEPPVGSHRWTHLSTMPLYPTVCFNLLGANTALSICVRYHLGINVARPTWVLCLVCLAMYPFVCFQLCVTHLYGSPSVCQCHWTNLKTTSQYPSMCPTICAALLLNFIFLGVPVLSVCLLLCHALCVIVYFYSLHV